MSPGPSCLEMIKHSYKNPNAQLNRTPLYNNVFTFVAVLSEWFSAKCIESICSSARSHDSYIQTASVLGPRGSEVERQSLASILSLSCAGPVAAG